MVTLTKTGEIIQGLAKMVDHVWNSKTFLVPNMIDNVWNYLGIQFSNQKDNRELENESLI